jgi:hypothetical protein
LAEGIGAELRQEDIDVLVAAPGATATENYLSSIPDGVTSVAPLMAPDVVAAQILNQLGKRHVFIPGWKNRLLAVVLGKLLPRKWAVHLMGKNTRILYAQR